jgi:nucleoside-diphosphate-sugar epimerase
VRVFVTGGAGFVGRRVVAGLLARGDTVVAPVRDLDRASDLETAGASVIADDLSDTARLAGHLRGADAAIHIAGMYRVGIPASQRAGMWDANVGTTTRLLEAAGAVGVRRIVYVSTVNVFGNTRGQVADEAWQRDVAAGFLSWYDETKYRAHEVAEGRIRAGARIVIVMPSQVYGRGDHSGFGEQMRLASEGRMPYRALDDVGVGLVHVDDLADGIIAALDHGRVGESYVLSGPRTTMGEATTLAAAVAGHKPARLRLPTGLLRVMAPLGGLIGQPNLREVISASAGVTYWASSTKAERELAFRPRSIEAGLHDTFGGG